MSSSDENARRSLRLRKAAAVLLAALCLFLLTPPGRAALRTAYRLSGFGGLRDASLSIHVLDVGKADAIVIACEGHLAVIDGGTAVHGETVVDYIARNRLGDSLDYVIVSHPDSDHLDGIAQVLEELPCGQFVRSPYFSEAYRQIDDIRESRGIPERQVLPGDKLMLGAAQLTVIGPVREYEEPNNASLVIRLDHPAFSALFTGDMEREAEYDLIDAGAALSADLLKVGHHGSSTSTTYALLRAVEPSFAVVSTGRDRSDLPREDVLKRLEAVCPAVYRTDVDGTVIFALGRNGLRVITEKTD